MMVCRVYRSALLLLDRLSRRLGHLSLLGSIGIWLMIAPGIVSKQPSTARLGITRITLRSMQGALMALLSFTAHHRSSTTTIWVSFYWKIVRFFPDSIL